MGCQHRLPQRHSVYLAYGRRHCVLESVAVGDNALVVFMRGKSWEPRLSSAIVRPLVVVRMEGVVEVAGDALILCKKVCPYDSQLA